MSDLPTIYVAEVECRRDESRDTVHVRGPGETRGWLDLPHPISTATYGLVEQADGETLSAERLGNGWCEEHATSSLTICEMVLLALYRAGRIPRITECARVRGVLLVRGVKEGQ